MDRCTQALPESFSQPYSACDPFPAPTVDTAAPASWRWVQMMLTLNGDGDGVGPEHQPVLGGGRVHVRGVTQPPKAKGNRSRSHPVAQ